MLEIATLIQYLPNDVKYQGEIIYTQSYFEKSYSDTTKIELEVEQYHSSRQFSYALTVTLVSDEDYNIYRFKDTCGNANAHELSTKINKARHTIKYLLEQPLVEEYMLLGGLSFSKITFTESMLSAYLTDTYQSRVL